jgi:hypothetical protein
VGGASVTIISTETAAKGQVTVSGAAPLVNPENPNTSTTLNAPALENLPNPGADMPYPLQFAPGALMNTAGSGNDFIGGTNGYGNVQFNGPAGAREWLYRRRARNERPANKPEQWSLDQSRPRPQFHCGSDDQHAFLHR